VRELGGDGVRADGRYVLYWMTAARRTSWNYALDHAVDLALRLDRPLLVLEALRCDYEWASDRLHRFVLQGMHDNAAAFARTDASYYPYVEPTPGAGAGLLAALGREACAVVTDDFPGFFHPRMLDAAAGQVAVSLQAVDSNGLLPVRATDRVFARAFDLRRFLQRELAPHLLQPPRRDPLASVSLRSLRGLPAAILRRWPRAEPKLLAADARALATLAIRHDVGPVELEGGASAGARRLAAFADARLASYADARNHPDESGTSGLSAYLHFGHVSPHAVLDEIARREGWTADRLQPSGSGAREGWWGMSAPAEAFLDQLVTWRELGLNFATNRSDIDRYESLPDWAQVTLAAHAGDRRPHLYDLEAFDAARTHDELWNAAQTELRESGCMHGYLRMLWGKKILHWSPDPRAALEAMVELNNRYALDGRDPNSYSGIFWVLGRYDRPWGPEREVFGKVRYMTSRNTRRKLRLDGYLERWGRSGATEPASHHDLG
jgi:deoxyribodipyrimidine photo-lyase